MNSSDFNKSPVHSDRVFATTSWSMVIKATRENDENAGAALNDLCETYWYPLYAFARRKGHERSAAEDLTQSFFAFLLEKDRLARADENRGRFRTFLLTSFTNFMTNEWRSEQALKRGGGEPVLSLDFETADKKYSVSPGDDITPEKIFERTWAMALLNQTLLQVKEHYHQTGKGELFDEIQVFLVGTSKASYKEIAERLKMREGAIKVAVHRLRERYGEQLRMQIARTLDDPTQVDDELKRLFEALGN